MVCCFIDINNLKYMASEEFGHFNNQLLYRLMNANLNFKCFCPKLKFSPRTVY